MAIRDDFTAGEVLAAADLNDTFASKVPYAYGTATPSTTVDGFVWYDENETPPAPKFWDGTAFQLVSPPSGLVHIATESFSAVSSVSLNGVFTADYVNYLIQYDALLASAGNPQGLVLRLRVSGVDTTTNYETQVWAVSNSGSGQVIGVVGRCATSGGGGVISMLKPFLAEKTTAVTQSHSLATTINVYTTMGGLFHNAATSFDGFSLLPAAGTITGTIRVYGYQSS